MIQILRYRNKSIAVFWDGFIIFSRAQKNGSKLYTYKSPFHLGVGEYLTEPQVSSTENSDSLTFSEIEFIIRSLETAKKFTLSVRSTKLKVSQLSDSFQKSLSIVDNFGKDIIVARIKPPEPLSLDSSFFTVKTFFPSNIGMSDINKTCELKFTYHAPEESIIREITSKWLFFAYSYIDRDLPTVEDFLSASYSYLDEYFFD